MSTGRPVCSCSTETADLLGLITARDLLFVDDQDKPVATVMTPRERLVTAPPGISMEEARALLHKHRIEKLPLVDGDGTPARFDYEP